MDGARVATFAAVVLLIAGPAQAAGIIKGPANMCVTAQPSSQARVTAQTCNLSDQKQKWEYVASKSELRMSSANGLCMDVAGGLAPKGSVIVYQCHGDVNQRWRTEQHEVNIGKGKFCLNLPAFTVGTQFNIDFCNGSANQALAYQAVTQ